MISYRTRAAIWASVVCLAVAASVSGISNGFAFDDVHIIVSDNRTHSLAHWWNLFAQSYWPVSKGGDLYRPITMLGFAAQWAIGGGAPLAFHVVSIVLYALVCAAFLGILLELLPASVAWLGAALFAVHPLHVEVVANVVGQAELLAALFMFLALLIFIRARRGGQQTLRDTGIIVLLYAAGCLSKEHALLLPLLLVAAEATVVASEAPIRRRLAAIRPLILVLGVVGLAILWIRMRVLGPSVAAPDEANALFLGQPYGVRAMTMLRVVLEWLRLFFWPAHLSADYSPRTIEMVTRPNVEILGSVAIVAGLGGLAWVARRAVPVATFAFLWTAIALLIPSNLLVSTGFVLAERTLFVASGGVMLAVASVVAYYSRDVTLSPGAGKTALGIVGVVLLLGVVASGLRQPVWRDDNTLFAQTVEDSPLSYQAHMAYATTLFTQKRRKEAFDQIGIAHALFPKDLGVLEYAAEQYSGVEGCQPAVGLFSHVLAEDPKRAESRVGLARCLTAMGRYADAREIIRQGLATGASLGAYQRLKVINDSTEAAYHTPTGR